MNQPSLYLKSARLLVLLVILLQGCGYSQTTSSNTVCITRTGSKFHLCHCRYLSQSSFEITRKEASSRGYTACSVCRPDTGSEEEDVEMETNEASEPASGGHSASPQRKRQTVKQQTVQPASGGARQCAASTQSGMRCKRTTTNANGRCWQHQ